MRNFKGVIFDLDGVIVSTDEYHYLAWQMIANREGIYFDRKINDRLRGISRMESLNIILERASREYSDDEKLEMATAKNNFYRESLKKLTKAEILPGVTDLIAELKKRSIRIAIGSSSKNTMLILNQIGLTEQFDAIADGNRIMHSKPDPEVFFLAAKMLNLLPEECIVVEDAVPGIQAASAAGAKPVAVGSAQGCDGAKYSVSDLNKLNIEEFLA